MSHEQSRQVLSSDGDRIQRVQAIRKAALLVAIITLTGVAVFSRPILTDMVWEGLLKIGGLVLMAVAITGRAWCSLYIGGRKKTEIVELGPYSVSRNPLYVFNLVGALGIGAQTGSVVFALAFGAMAAVVFHFTVRREEAWLSTAFGQAYDTYCGRTPRFWPNFNRWRDAETLEVKPRFFLLTLRDGLAFLLATPIFAAVEHARHSGWTAAIFPII